MHGARLQQMSSRALQLEAGNPRGAIDLWRQCLALLPTEAPQRLQIEQRIDALAASRGPVLDYQPAPPRTHDPWGIALLKTGGSMVVSILVYAYFFGNPWFAAAFVLLILIHEMGHVFANLYYGLSASPPIFVPFVGAIINLRERPANAKVEAVIGIAGPVMGTIGSLAMFIYSQQMNSDIALVASHFGFMMNLFNLLPVPPLDGGRVTAAVSPWAWILGLAGLGWLMIHDLMHGRPDYILLIVLIYAFPRIKATLRGRDRFSEYYRISRAASWTIGVVYVMLAAALLLMFQLTRYQVQ